MRQLLKYGFKCKRYITGLVVVNLLDNAAGMQPAELTGLALTSAKETGKQAGEFVAVLVNAAAIVAL
jgi:hypothetical protein